MPQEEFNNLEQKTEFSVGRDDFKDIPGRIKRFIVRTISIRSELDVDGAQQSIKGGIEFAGSSVWILICSIIIASVGLNNNSVAVIIGAMLISPLMGPIRGIGLAVGTNDLQTLIRSLINFGVMVGVSLFASYLYFKVSPLKADSSELLGRVKPHLLDVLIAFFGGMAGIIATVSKNKGAAMTIVPGVAIATALMPPLCTAGYGMAIGNWNYFFGAIYLFLLNSIFICLSTLIIIRLLKFPVVQFVSLKVERLVKVALIVFLLLIVVPSVSKFINIIKETIFEQQVTLFLNEIRSSSENLKLDADYDYNEGNSHLKLWINGFELSQREEEIWRKILAKYELDEKNLKFTIHGGFKRNEGLEEPVNDMLKYYMDQEVEMAELKKRNDFFVSELQALKGRHIALSDFGRNINAYYPEIIHWSYATEIKMSIGEVADTIHHLKIKWPETLSLSQIKSNNLKIENAFRLQAERDQMHLDSLTIE